MKRRHLRELLRRVPKPGFKESDRYYKQIFVYAFPNNLKSKSNISTLEKETNIVLSSSKQSGIFRVWVGIGHIYNLSLAPFYNQFDALIILDNDPEVLRIIKKQNEIFPTAKGEENFYQELKKDEERNLDPFIRFHKRAKNPNYLEAFHCFSTPERMKICQAAVRELSQKTIFCHIDIFDPKAIKVLNEALSIPTTKVVGLTADNLAEWALTNSYDKIIHNFGRYLYKEFTAARESIIFSSFLIGWDKGVYLHKGIKEYWDNVARVMTINSFKSLILKHQFAKGSTLYYVSDLFLTNKCKYGPLQISLKNYESTNEDEGSLWRCFPKISKEKKLEPGDSIFHLLARSADGGEKDEIKDLQIMLCLLHHINYGKVYLKDCSNKAKETPVSLVQERWLGDPIRQGITNHDKTEGIKYTGRFFDMVVVTVPRQPSTEEGIIAPVNTCDNQ